MKKSLLASTAALLAIAAPASAAPQPSPGASSCPPGSGFCGDAPQLQPLPAGQPVHAAPPTPTPTPTPASAPLPPLEPPMVVVESPPPPPAMARQETPEPYVYQPPPRAPFESRAREWGMSLHLQGSFFGRGSGGDSAMGGLGAGARFKPTRRFGIEGDLDFSGGKDYLGQSRGETALTFNALFFVNPRSRAQVYLLAGLGWSWAHVTCDATMSCGAPLDQDWRYFGAQIGAGVEGRLNRTFALDADLRGFLRGRTDALATVQPEFTDVSGRTSNTSAGWLLTLGGVVYF